MRTVRDIIEDLGGSSAVAKAHNPPLAQSTVHGWVTSNFVPRWRVPALLEIAKSLGKSLAENDFPPKDQRLKAVG
jgi:hypothetical protein